MAQQLTASDRVALATEVCKQSRAKAVQWILDRVSPDGEPLGAQEKQTYYRLPWTLAVSGEQDVASRVLTWIERNSLSSDGDLLRTGDPKQDFVTRWASYPLAIIAMGAWHLERASTALNIMRTLRRFQEPTTGGAFGERPEVRNTGRQDLFPTAQLGMAALTTGQDDMAQLAYEWIAGLYAAQPDLPARLYTAVTADGLIVSPHPSVEWDVVTDFELPRQAFYNPGIAAAFLARYHMHTGDQQALVLGRSYLALTINGTPAQFDYRESAQVCKFAWGSALMLTADPSGDYLPYVLQMIDWFVDSQLPDGRWHNSPFLVPKPTDVDDLAVTAEFALHLTTIMAALGGLRRS